jgi:SAM-dependent methyltransferase
MADLSRLDPTTRFTDRAGTYALYRPTYPDVAIDYVLTHCRLGRGSLLVDVGCGTGISARAFAARGLDVIGIEPNAAMRAAAESSQPERGGPAVTYLDGRAEATGLESGVADAILSAQAFHWFEPDQALAEFHRILKPTGWVILMWNERDESDQFTARYGSVIRSAPDAAAIENARSGQAANALLQSPLFRDASRVAFTQHQSVDEEGLLGRAFSTSYAPSDPDEINRWSDRLTALFRDCNHEGKVLIRYETSVYLARRNR